MINGVTSLDFDDLMMLTLQNVGTSFVSWRHPIS
jgi:hypothetical protein